MDKQFSRYFISYPNHEIELTVRVAQQIRKSLTFNSPTFPNFKIFNKRRINKKKEGNKIRAIHRKLMES